MTRIMSVLLAITFGSAMAWASLGDYENSVALDQKVMHGEVRAILKQGYSVQEITAGEQTIVREYVAPSGLVFGIAWHGPTMPNLQQLLGSYFGELQQARNTPAISARLNVARRGPLVMHSDKLIVESGGHMRSFHGRAFVPALLPQGISAEVVQ